MTFPKTLVLCALATLAAVTFTAAPTVAFAADVVSPRDGETIASRPQFTFDFASGAAVIELSRSPDVKTAGDDSGGFVEREAGDFVLIGPSYGLAAGVGESWEASRINAGRYFWHAKADDDADDIATDFAPAVWGPVRTVIVRDEPVVLEGWTASARRGRTRGKCARVSLSGSIAWSDNSSSPSARYSVRVRAGGRTLRSLTGRFGEFDRQFGGVVCTRARKLTVTASLRDPGGHLAVAPPRHVSVRRG